MAEPVPQRTVGRISLYRRLLSRFREDNASHVFSHQLARAAGVTPAQVRRDLMSIGYSGSPARGYDLEGLAAGIAQFLDSPVPEPAALIGVGNLGRAILAYFEGRRPNLAIVAAFDRDKSKTGRAIHGCRCYPVGQLARVMRQRRIGIAVLAVPAEEGQGVADRLVKAGVRGILNFAPVHLRVPAGVYVEDVDITTSLEKVAFFARRSAPARA